MHSQLAPAVSVQQLVESQSQSKSAVHVRTITGVLGCTSVVVVVVVDVT